MEKKDNSKVNKNDIKVAVLEEKIDNVSKEFVSFKKEIKHDLKNVENIFANHDKWERDYREVEIKSKAEDHLTILDKISSLEEKLDKKYSAKWVEWAVKGLFSLLGTGIVGVVIYYITVH